MQVHSALLAQELIDLIIDYAHDDKALLRACTLVCKAWLPSSRLHLFDTVKAHSVHSPSDLADLLGPICFITKKYEHISQINTYVPHHLDLNSKSPLHYVRHLTFTISSCLADILPLPEAPGRIRFLPGVQSLTVSYWRSSLPKPCALDTATSIYPNITTLTLEHATFPSISNMVRAIASFSQLERIELVECRCDDMASVDFSHFPPPPRLHSLAVDPVGMHPGVLEWAISGTPSAVIRNLSLKGIDKDMASFGRFTAAHGKELLELELSFLYTDENQDVFGHHPILPLRHLRNLRSFTYSDIRVEDDAFPFQVLQSIPASLKHLNISIRDDDEMWEEDLEWYFEDLRWVLRLEQFAGLEKLEVWLLTELRTMVPKRVKSINQVARRVLEDWEKSGVLEVVDGFY